MVAFLVVYSALALIGIVVALRHARKAPQGYEDSEGFHYGVDPALHQQGATATGDAFRKPISTQAAARQNLGGTQSGSSVYTRG